MSGNKAAKQRQNARQIVDECIAVDLSEGSFADNVLLV
jgi:hypothetical protein